MPRKPKPGSLAQIDWLIVNLRWLLLISVGVVAFLDPTRARLSDLNMLLTFSLLAAGVTYNALVMIILTFSVQAPFLPLLTIVADGLLSVGLVFVSGRAHSLLYFSGLLPIITAALRFGWVAG